MLIVDNRVKMQVSNSPNASTAFTGTNGSPASGGFINLESAKNLANQGVAIATGDQIPYCAFVDSLFECGIGTIDTSAHTLTRPTAIISNSAGTTVRIDFSGATTNPTIITGWDAILGQSSYNLMRNGIQGLELLRISATSIAASPGSAFIESINGAPMKVTQLATVAPSLAADTWYYAYVYVSGGVLTIEGVTAAPVAFAIPAGNARSKTADASRRFIAPFRTDGSGNILPFTMYDLGAGIGRIVYDSWQATPLAGGTATSYTAVSLVTRIPPALAHVMMGTVVLVTGAAGDDVTFSLDGTTPAYALQSPAPSSALRLPIYAPINQATPNIYYKMSIASASAHLLVQGYDFRK